MIGNKLHNLNKELSVSQRKTLIHQCSISSDKRMGILKNYLQNSPKSIDELNQFLIDTVNFNWPNSEQKEKDLKVRRLSSFFVEQIEKLILETYLESSTSIKNILMAQALGKGGNIYLLNHYYEKAYSKAIEEEDYYYQMIGLKGKIRMSYTSQNEKDLAKALDLNEELLRVLRHANNDKVAEYYFNISNIYLEKNSLVSDQKDELEAQIKKYIDRFDYPVNKASLYVSLAKLNFNNESLTTYFQKAKEILYSVEQRNKDFHALDRKIRFLELRLLFFAGTENSRLLQVSDEIMQHFQGFSIINNNTLFYKILFTIFDDQLDLAEQLLEENSIFFGGEGKITSSFLRALIHEKKEEYKEAIQLLQTLIYTTNYFLAVFSRLLYIKIQIDRGKESMIKPLVDSTQRLLIQNSGNPLGKEAHQYVLKELKSRASSSNATRKLQQPTLTVFHKYLLNLVD